MLELENSFLMNITIALLVSFVYYFFIRKEKNYKHLLILILVVGFIGTFMGTLLETLIFNLLPYLRIPGYLQFLFPSLVSGFLLYILHKALEDKEQI